MNTTILKPNPGTTTILLGISTVISQSILLREAMAAMGGSEMAWGVVMACWLAGMGIGSRAGVRIGSPALGRLLPVLTPALACAGALLFRAAPAILDTTAGESLTTLHGLWLWPLAIVPAAAAGGLAFPILAADLGVDGPGRAYALEAVGALIGGLILSAWLAQLGTIAALLIVIGAVGGVILWQVRPVLGIALAVICLAAQVPAGDWLAEAGWRWSRRPGELGSWTETRRQRFEASAGRPTAVYADGRLAATFPDPFTTLPEAHLIMLLHTDPERVLAVGCTIDGSVEALIRHPVHELILVEDDPSVFRLLGRWYGDDFLGFLDRDTVRTLATDPLPALAHERNLDLVILADGDPTTLRGNRTRTVEFFTMCRRALNDSGVLVVRVGVSDTYLGGTAGTLLETLISTLREVFPNVVAVPGNRILLVAGGPSSRISLDVPELERRLAKRPSAAAALPAQMLGLLVDPTRQKALEQFVDSAAAPLNTATWPRAVIFAAGLHEARSQPTLALVFGETHGRGRRWLVWILAAAIAGSLATATLPRRPIRAAAAAAVVGATSMGWWLLLLGIWQTTRGSVYAEIGVLTGLFMAGVAIGGRFGLRARRRGLSLPTVICCGALLSLLIAAGVPRWAPVVLVPCFLAVGGALTGRAFGDLGTLAGGGSARHGAGIAFAADEIGAAAAALTIGTVAVPWVGMAATAVGLALLGLAAIPAVLRS